MAKKEHIKSKRIVLIGGSAGSLEVLLRIFPLVKQNLQTPIVLIIHRGSSPGSPLHELLAVRTSIPVSEIEDKDLLHSNHIYITPGDYHLLFEKDHSFSLDDSEKVNFSRPSIDVSFESGASVFGENAVGILLSGANSDGTNGLRSIKFSNGTTIVQAPDSAQVGYMPQHAINHVKVDYVMNIEEIISFINALP